MLPVWVILMVFLTTQISCIFGIVQTLTFMTVKKTWNEASLVCNMNGGYLYKDGSTAVTEAVGIFGDEEPWKSHAYIDGDIWIGLGFSGYSVPTGNPIYMWNNDCSAMDNANDYTDWHPSEPKFPDSRECIYRKRQGSNWNWFTSICSSKKYYICQKDSGHGPCFNPPIYDRRGAGVEDEVYPGVTLAQCDIYCSTAKCVAYSFNQATGQCYIYIHYDILHFDDAANQHPDTGYVLYRMGCFEAAVDDTDYGVVNTNSGVDVPCAALENSETTPDPTEQTTTTPETTEQTTTTLETTEQTTATLETTEQTTTTLETTEQTTATPETTEQTTTTLETTEQTTATPETSEQTTTTPETAEQTTATPEPVSQSTTMLAFSTTTSYSAPLSNSLSSNLCHCKCILHSNFTSMDEDLYKKVVDLQSKLAVKKTALSKTKRRLTSADDNRASSVGLGIVAIMFLAFCSGAMIAVDVHSVYTAYHFKTKKRKSRK